MGASFSYKNEKTIIFDTKDYRVNNRSSGSDFKVSFEREFDKCAELTRQELGCYFTAPHWGKSWVFDKTKFNPISYANFKPSYDVIYEAPPNQNGITRFHFGTKFIAKARYGDVVPSLLFSVYGPAGSSWIPRSFNTSFTIDWSHPLFEPEAHVTLQSLRNNDLCLDVNSKSDQVRGQQCNGRWNHTWGLDPQERYRSRVSPDRCLTVSSLKTLTVESCGNDLSQKWFWEGEKLISRYVDGDSNARYILNIKADNNVGVSPESEATHKRWKPSLQNIKKP